MLPSHSVIFFSTKFSRTFYFTRAPPTSLIQNSEIQIIPKTTFLSTSRTPQVENSTPDLMSHKLFKIYKITFSLCV